MPRHRSRRPGFFERNPWIPFLVPFIVFMAVTMLEPTADTPGGKLVGLTIPYSAYPGIYTTKIVLTTLSLLFCVPALRKLPWRVSFLGIGIGLLGGAVWIALSEWAIERTLIEMVGLGGWLPGGRSGFDPLAELSGDPGWAYGFLAIRFFGFVFVIAMAEELFLRGFLLRFVVDVDWWTVPIGKVTALGAALATIVPVSMHPEWFAAAVWFSGITWLCWRTKSLGECVAAHAVTNLVVGIYVLATGHWYLM